MRGKTAIRTDRLKALREKQGLTRRDLARLCELGEAQISKYELGHSDVTAMNLKAIAEILGTSTDYLLGLSNDPEKQLAPDELSVDELDVVEAYRREGWLGIIRLGTDRLSSQMGNS